jgi:8-oxo-dGTP pyrophosphatase MutT (NUDIX family)
MSRTPLTDPQAAPVLGTDAHLPAIDAARLAPQALRERFAAPPEWAPEFAGDGVQLAPLRGPVPAAVLLPLVQRPEGLQLLLTQRAAHLRDHAGQISFPGGRTEACDADAAATALRESEEEVGLQRARVEVIGRLPVYSTGSGFVITPVVALVRPPLELRLDAYEVAEAFEVPLDFLMTPANHQRHALEFAGEERRFLSMPWRGPGPEGATRSYFIWGATAAMLRNFYRFLAAE